MTKNLYMVQNDNGQYLSFAGHEKWVSCRGDIFDTYAGAEHTKYAWGKKAHVVTLTQQEESVTLPEYVAKFVKVNKGGSAFTSLDSLYDDMVMFSGENNSAMQDWLFAQYTDTTNKRVRLLMKLLDKDDHTKILVEGPKKYLLPLQGLNTSDGEQQYLSYRNGDWFASRKNSDLMQEFTAKQLEKAPKWISESGLVPQEVIYGE